jgi:hypothetical protein
LNCRSRALTRYLLNDQDHFRRSRFLPRAFSLSPKLDLPQACLLPCPPGRLLQNGSRRIVVRYRPDLRPLRK